MATSDHVIKFRTELDNMIVVRPGDKLIVARTDRISPPDIIRLKARIAELLPGVEPVIISECSGLAVYRGDDDVPPERDRATIAMIAERLRESDEALSAAWLRQLLAHNGRPVS